MPKNDQYRVDKPRNDEKKKVHPVWRGIGCVMMVIIPLISYIGAVQLVNNRATIPWVMIPPEIVYSAGKDPLIFVKILYAIIITFLLYLLMAIVTFVINRFFGPSRYGKYDVPN
jgi:hypothetical protein